MEVGFELIHNNCAPSGLMLHCLPAFHDVDHGFWNIHPTTYFDIARENNYVIEDFVYVDNLPARMERVNRGVLQATNFDEFPIKMHDAQMPDGHMQDKVFWTMLQNLNDTEGMALAAGYRPRLFDHCYVAMRMTPETSDKPFRYPQQGAYQRSFIRE